MKRTLALLLALLLFSGQTLFARAETVPSPQNDGGTPTYCVTVNWNDPVFCYNGTRVWDPVNLTETIGGSWTLVSGSSEITVTNTSDAPVIVTLTCEQIPVAGLGTAGAAFGVADTGSGDSFTLAAGDAYPTENYFTLWMYGTPTDAVEQTQFASLTVTVTAADG